MEKFEQLRDKYGLCSKDFYSYLQLRDYLSSHVEYNALKQQPSPLEHFLVKCIEENSKKMVSNIYKHLRTHFSENSLDIKKKWELEINVTEDDEWKLVCEQGHRVTHSPVWKEFNWKLKMRYFKIPSVTSKYDKNNKNLCWMKCKQIGDHIHIFWDCPILIPFWQGIQAEIQDILKIKLPLNPLHYILGLTPGEDIGKWNYRFSYLWRGK